MSAHTAGPWRRGDHPLTKNIVYADYSMEPAVVAHCQTAADADLVAAAPSLLEALEDVLYYIPAGLEKAIRARDIIAKARGLQ